MGIMKTKRHGKWAKSVARLFCSITSYVDALRILRDDSVEVSPLLDWSEDSISLSQTLCVS